MATMKLMVTGRELTTKERIVVHLFEIKAIEVPGKDPIKVASEASTQDGIAAILGMTQANVSIELGRAVRAGMLIGNMSHVKGQRRQTVAYALTFQGVKVARTIKQKDECQARLEGERGAA